MRILHVSQPTTEGTAAVVMQLVEAGMLAGHEVSVACPGDGELSTAVLEQGAQWVELGMSRKPGASDLRALGKLRTLLRDFDLVHLHSSKAGALGRIASAWLSHGPAVAFTPHGWSWYTGGRMGHVYKVFEKAAFRLADAVVAVSREEYVDGRRVLGDSSKLRLIENGVDTRRFSPAGEPREATLVVLVGRLSKQKGQDRLLRATARLLDLRFEVVLVGDGPDGSTLRELCNELGLTERVTFAGRHSALPYFRRATVAVFPSRWEGLPLALLEAMACETPVIASPAAGADAVGLAGLVLRDTTEDELISSLEEQLRFLLLHPDERARLGSQARQRVVQLYSVERVTGEHLRLYEELCELNSIG